MADPRQKQLQDQPRRALPPAPDTTEAFGSGCHRAPPPPGYEAFGRAQHRGNGHGARAETRTPRPDAPDEKPPGEEPRRKKEQAEENRLPAEKARDELRAKEDEDKKGPPRPPVYKRPAVVIAGAVALLLIIAVGIAWWLYARQFQSTDDAFIDGDVTVISPQVSAPVKILHITDNQFVHQGDLLVELNPTDFQVALAQAQGAQAAAAGRLAQAQAQIASANAGVDQAAAEVDAAQVQLTNATRDLARYQNVDPRARSQQQLDTATTTQKNAAAQLEQAKARKTTALANVENAKAAVKAAQGDLAKADADVQRAQVNLSYCRIQAPCDGRVTERSIEPGAYIATGQAMFSLVSPDVWVTANFKETQLRRMRPGQSVSIKVDALGGKKFPGHVDSIQAGSGARFSVLPAENATGNFVKVVQRVPVKIRLDPDAENANARLLLAPGMSVVPKVMVR